MKRLLMMGLAMAALGLIAVGGCNTELDPVPTPDQKPPSAPTPTPGRPCGLYGFPTYCNTNFVSTSLCGEGGPELHSGPCLPEEGAACAFDGSPLRDGGSGSCPPATYCSSWLASRCVKAEWQCGQDFRTYGSWGELGFAGTSQLHEGRCLAGEGVACNPAAFNECAAGLECDAQRQRCVKPTNLCSYSQAGTRWAFSLAAAAQQGDAILHYGACLIREGEACGSADGGTPDAGGACYTGLDCEASSGRCLKVGVVCGTDFKSYMPPETAAAAGVSVLHIGACLPQEGQACVPGTASACSPGTACERSRSACLFTQPVCGADHRTYPFVSEAQYAGVSIVHRGACLPEESTVCGRDFKTYATLDAMEQAGVPLLHFGACLEGEGTYCRADGGALPDGGALCRPGLVCDAQREVCVKP